MKEIRIKIYQVIGNSAAVSSEDGKSLFKRIDESLENNLMVILDFSNIEFLTSAFLNTAIGQLYSKYDSPFLRQHLKVENMEKEDLLLLKKVVLTAKKYFSSEENKERIEKSVEEALEDDKNF